MGFFYTFTLFKKTSDTLVKKSGATETPKEGLYFCPKSVFAELKIIISKIEK